MPQSIAFDEVPRPDGALRLLAEKSNSLVEEYLESSRAALASLLLKPDLLRDVALERKEGSYARNLLFGDARMSVWAMVWAPGSMTSVHDHHCSCCFGILNGALTEIRYHAIDEGRVVERQRLQRNAGFIDCLLPGGPNIHRMVNESDRDAVSIHIYGYDHRLHTSSVKREYVVVPG